MGAEVVRVSLTKPQTSEPADKIMSGREAAEKRRASSESSGSVNLAQFPDGGMEKVTEELGKESCLKNFPGWNGHFY